MIMTVKQYVHVLQILLTFRPSKNNDHLNGVTTYDLVLISKHILGVEPLGSPYRMIAADANKSNSITTFDIVEFRKLLLGIDDTLPNNTSWRFVSRNFVFTNPDNPFTDTIPEEIGFTIPPPTNQVSFYGIKIGDVNEFCRTAIGAFNTQLACHW
jgi:hypothetical protein